MIGRRRALLSNYRRIGSLFLNKISTSSLLTTASFSDAMVKLRHFGLASTEHYVRMYFDHGISATLIADDNGQPLPNDEHSTFRVFRGELRVTMEAARKVSNCFLKTDLCYTAMRSGRPKILMRCDSQHLKQYVTYN